MNSPRSLILDVGVRAVFHTILVFAIFLLLSGHNAPGGGFAAGLVAGAAFVLQDVAAAFDPRARRTRRLVPETALAVGLLVAVTTGLVPLFTGDTLLESAKATLELPFFGTVKVNSALAFDIGVFFVVLGVILTMVERLGDESDDVDDFDEASEAHE